jgi:hypothetical protein
LENTTRFSIPNRLVSQFYMSATDTTSNPVEAPFTSPLGLKVRDWRQACPTGVYAAVVNAFGDRAPQQVKVHILLKLLSRTPGASALKK